MSGEAKLALETWKALLSAHRGLFRSFVDDSELWSDLSMNEYDVLYTLSSAPSPLRLCDLTESVLLSQPALSRLVDRLALRGLIEKTPDPEDGRSSRLSLTPQGTELQREIGWSHGREIFRELSSRIGVEDQRELLRICEKLAVGSKDEAESDG